MRSSLTAAVGLHQPSDFDYRPDPSILSWSDEDDGFIATVPDLPGYNAWGRTAVEAAAQIEDAQAAWIEACEASGDPVPQPKTLARRAACPVPLRGQRDHEGSGSFPRASRPLARGLSTMQRRRRPDRG